jgi:hypothetical protein
MKRWMLLCGCLCLPVLAQAADVICTSGGQVRYLLSQDQTQLTDSLCSAVPKSQTAAQRQLLADLHTLVPSVLHSPNVLRYVNVITTTLDGVAVRLLQAKGGTETTGEIGQVNATVDAETADRASVTSTLADPDICAATLATINSKLDTSKAGLLSDLTAAHTTAEATIEALTGTPNLAMLKGGLKGVNDQLLAQQTTELNALYTVLQKMARCLVALRGRP